MPTSTPPSKPSFNDRQLAAIVFTDVAGFSALMERNERHTLLLVQRDLKLIGDVCHKLGGEVLKNTGDGCLATFHSVESAVGSALRIQRIIAEARTRLPPEEILHHRIGIHLGDVFLGQGDVMGNGVNIAARLLAEAEPDGICISQTVYDLVKHQLNVKAICIGARELKNIREAVQVYRLVLSAVAEEQGVSPPATRRSSRGKVLAIGAVVILLATGVAAWTIIHSGKSKAFVAAATSLFVASATSPSSTTQSPTPVAPTTDPEYELQIPQRKPDHSVDSGALWRKSFHTFSREFLSTTIEGNSYVMTVQADGGRAFFSASPWDGLEDVTIQATGDVHGPPFSAWGVQLVAENGSHKLARVLIAVSGTVKIDLSRLNGADASNLPLNPAGQIFFPHRAKAGGTDTNTLLLAVHDHKMSVLVNGQSVGTSFDIGPLGPSTLVLVVEGSKGSVATFDSLQKWIPHRKPDQ